MGLLLTLIEGLMADALQLWLLAVANVGFIPCAFAGIRPQARQAAIGINPVSNKSQSGIQVRPSDPKLIMSEKQTSLNNNTTVDPQTDQQHLNPRIFLEKNNPLWLSAPTSDVTAHRNCLATICDFWLDRGGLTTAALNEKDLAIELQGSVRNPDLARTILTKRTRQSLARLEQAVTAVFDFFCGASVESENEKPLTLEEMVQRLRDIAADGYEWRVDDWRTLVDMFEASLVDINDLWKPELASPGCIQLGEMAELRFSFVTTYAHALEFMQERHSGFVAPKLAPEMTVAELCAEVGILPMVTPSEAILPDSLK